MFKKAIAFPSIAAAIANPDVQLVEDKENIEESAKTDSTMQSLAAIHTRARAGETGFDQYTYKGVNKFLAFSQIEGSDGWTICINAPVSDFTDGVMTTIYVSIALMVIFIGLGLFAAIKIANGIANPISIFADRVSKLAEGEMTSPMPDVEAASTEIQVLKQSLQHTLNNTKLVISDIDYLLTDISNGNLDIFSKCPESYVDDYRDIFTAFRRLKKRLSQSFGDISSVAEQVSAGLSQVSFGAQSLAQGATEQASSVEALSSQAEVLKNQIGQFKLATSFSTEE